MSAFGCKLSESFCQAGLNKKYEGIWLNNGNVVRFYLILYNEVLRESIKHIFPPVLTFC